MNQKLFLRKKTDNFTAGGVTANSATVLSTENVRNRGGEYKNLTSAEMRDKREKGLYFRCDEPYNREHRYKNRQFRMLIIEGEDEEEESIQEEELQGSFQSILFKTYI